MTPPTSDRERLIRAARDILMEDGYDAVTPAAACGKAGLDAHAYDRSFATRDDLVVAALDAHWADLKPFLDQAFAAGVPPLEQLRRFFEGVYGFQNAQWSRLGCVVGCLLLRAGSAAPRMDQKVRQRVGEMLQETHGYVEGAIRTGQRQGKIRPGDVPTMAWTLIHYMEGVLGLARIQNDLHTLGGMMERSLEFLGAEPSTAPH
jgi:TetR/AcrR family transcriptional repressor of nem operon